MLRDAGATGAGGSARVLTSGVVRRLLDGFRLPSYEYLGYWLKEAGDREHLADLWKGVFGEAAPEVGVFDSEIAFVGRVNEELFPVDLRVMDSMLGMSERPLQYAIPVYSYGVPWEIAVPSELDSWDRPMVAVVYAAGLCKRSELFLEMRGGNAEDFDDWAAHWWEQQGFDEAPVLTWPKDRERAVRRLKELPAPLNGLAGVYGGVMKNTGSVFFDWPGGYWQGEYADFELYCWCTGCIEELRDQFAPVREDVERLIEYIKWWSDSDVEQRRRVVEALVGLEGDDG